MTPGDGVQCIRVLAEGDLGMVDSRHQDGLGELLVLQRQQGRLLHLPE